MPNSRFVTIPGAAHFPHIDDPEAVAAALADFTATTEPGWHDETTWRELLRHRSPARPRPRAVA